MAAQTVHMTGLVGVGRKGKTTLLPTTVWGYGVDDDIGVRVHPSREYKKHKINLYEY